MSSKTSHRLDNSQQSGGSEKAAHSDISSEWKFIPRPARLSLGFQNKGVRCYSNSLVIALLHLPKVVNWLDQYHTGNACVKARCVACTLAKLSEAYWHQKPDRIAVERLLARFEAEIALAPNKSDEKKWLATEYGQQEDVQEFYSFLVNKLKDQLTMYIPGVQATSDIPTSDCHHHSDEKILSIISDLFELKIKKTSTCAHGHTDSLETVPHNPLVLPCNRSIDQAIQGVFADESMPDIECGPCKHRATKTYQRTIANPPDILCTHFNRFERSGKRSKKVQRDIAFSGELDLSPYVDAKTPLRYQLLAAIHHEGTLAKGHYITYTKSPQGSWGRQDNTDVREATIEEATHSKGRFTPYLLFWQKLPPTIATPGSKSRKRSREASPSLDPVNTDCPRAKSPKTGQAVADSPGGKSRSIWRFEWLYGNPHAGKKLATELKDCKRERERKDEVIRNQKELIDRAALTHSELLTTCNHLRNSLEAWKRATTEITPMMHHVEAHGGRNSHKASGYLRMKGLAEGRESAGLSRLRENERMAGLLEDAEGGKNPTFEAFLTDVSKAANEGTLGAWLNKELNECDLPRPKVGSQNGN